MTINTCTARPNNDLSYIIGQNFCLEDETSFPNGISVHCPLKYKPFPEATFAITATQVLNNGSRQELTKMTKNYLFLDREDLSPLFDDVTQHVNVTCRVYNSVGDDTNSTIIRRCSKYKCLQKYLYSYNSFTKSFVHILL